MMHNKLCNMNYQGSEAHSHNESSTSISVLESNLRRRRSSSSRSTASRDMLQWTVGLQQQRRRRFCAERKGHIMHRLHLNRKIKVAVGKKAHQR